MGALKDMPPNLGLMVDLRLSTQVQLISKHAMVNSSKVDQPQERVLAVEQATLVERATWLMVTALEVDHRIVIPHSVQLIPIRSREVTTGELMLSTYWMLQISLT